VSETVGRIAFVPSVLMQVSREEWEQQKRVIEEIRAENVRLKDALASLLTAGERDNRHRDSRRGRALA